MSSATHPSCACCLRPCFALRINPSCCLLVKYCSSSCQSKDCTRHALFHSAELGPAPPLSFIPPSRSAAVPPHTSCAACGSPASRTCKGCSSTSYCSPACQRSHWPDHRASCSNSPAKLPVPPPPTDKRDLFFWYVRRFHKCRTDIEAKWRSFGSSRRAAVEQVKGLDLVETSPGLFDSDMRQRSLEGSVVQDLESLSCAAAAAIPALSVLVFGALAAVDLPPNYLHMAPLKSAKRAAEKARDDYSQRPDGPGVSWLFDMVRGSVECEHPEEAAKLVVHLVEMGVVVRLKNRFATPTPGGFRDFNLNIRVAFQVQGVQKEGLYINHICELQVHVKVLKEFGKSIGSHEVYNFFRKYFAGGTEAVEKRLALMDRIFKRDATTPGQNSSIDEVVNEVCAEGDMERMEATAALVNTMCAFDLASKIRKAQATILGPGHIDTLEQNYNLANSLFRQGKYEEAKVLFTQTMEGCTRVYGAGHPNTLQVVANLAASLRQQDQQEEAKALFKKVVDGYTRALGPGHPETLNAIGNLAAILHRQDKYEEATALYAHVVEGLTVAFGADHSKTVDTLGNQAALLMEQGKHEEAKVLYTEVIERCTRAFGADHTDTLRNIGNLANLLSAQGQYEDARIRYEQVVEGLTSSLGVGHTSTLMNKGNLASLLCRQKKFEEAKTLLVQVIEGLTSAVGAGHTMTLVNVGSLGSVLCGLGEYEEAKALLERAVKGLTRAVGPNHPQTILNMGNLSACLRLQLDPGT